MHLSRSHQMFSHRTTIIFFGFLALQLYRRKILKSILLYLENIRRLTWCSIISLNALLRPSWKIKMFFAFTDFESRHVYAEDINNMLRDLWTAWSLVPFSHGWKVLSNAIFASRVITKKCTVSIFSLLQFHNPFPEHITFAKNLSKQAACHLQKQKSKAPKFYFLPSKLKLGYKNWFNSYKSSKTHRVTRKQSQFHYQNPKNTRSPGGEKQPMVIEPTLVKDPTSPLQIKFG